MSYTPTTWTNGDKLTAVKLNKIEQGISSAHSNSSPTALILTETTILQTTPAQVIEAMKSGRNVILKRYLDNDQSESKVAYDDYSSISIETSNGFYCSFGGVYNADSLTSYFYTER